ncbi:MAG: S-layer homology domain-containing protein [Firmicutes bacterium]|nr:S-layer homology domain-containing protein [Bacillota bacterium]
MKRRILALILVMVFSFALTPASMVFSSKDTNASGLLEEFGFTDEYLEYLQDNPKALLELMVDMGFEIDDSAEDIDECEDIYCDHISDETLEENGETPKESLEESMKIQAEASIEPMSEQSEGYTSFAMQGIIDAFAFSKDPDLQVSFDFSNFEFVEPRNYPMDEELFGVWDPVINDFVRESKSFNLQGPTGALVGGRIRVMTVPLLDYDYVSPYPGVNLNSVKQAAIEGNYAKAKDELYKYYQKKLEARGVTNAASADRQTRLRANLLLQNMHLANSSYANVGDIIYMDYLGSDFKQITFEMTEQAVRFMTERNTYNWLMPVQILAVNKDGYEAEFLKGAKGEDGYYPVLGESPYLEVKVGNTTKYIPAKYITYTRAGNPYANQTFGDDPAIYACESRTSIRTAANTDPHSMMKLPVDEGTKRTYIMFDLRQGMNAGEQISSATLIMRGRFYPANDGVQPAVANPPHPNYKKRIVALTLGNVGWTDKARTGADAPMEELYFGNQSIFNVAFSYEGEYGTAWRQPIINDGTDPVLSRGGNPPPRFEEDISRGSSWYSIMNNQFLASGNQLYAQTFIMYLQDWIMKTYNRYTGGPGVTYPRTSGGRNIPGLVGGGWRKGLDLHSRSSNWPGTISRLMGSKTSPSPMTAEIFTVFLKYAWSMGETHSQYWTNQEAGNNWGTASTNGWFQIMGNYPEFFAIDNPVYDKNGEMLRDSWINILMERIDENTGNMVFDDGACWELAAGYNQYAITTMFGPRNTAESLQFDLQFSDVLIQRMVDLCRALMITTAPGWRNTQIGDGGAYSKSSNFRSDIAKAGYWLEHHPVWGPKVQDIVWVATRGDEKNSKARGTPPDFTSYRYWDSRKVVMRTGWDTNALFLYTSADANDGSHGHWDDNNIIVAGYGDSLLSDSGFYAYDSAGMNLEIRWLYSSRAHNVMQMNDFSSKSHGSSHDKALPITDGSALDQNGRRGLRLGNIMEATVLNDAYDFSRIYSHTYKDLTYRIDPVILPGKGDGSIPHDDGMDYKRNILFVRPNFWIISDHMDPVGENIGKVNKYSQLWHMMPEAGISIDGCIGPFENNTVKMDSRVANTVFVTEAGNGTIRSNRVGGANLMVVPADIDSVEPMLLWGRVHAGTGLFNSPYGVFEKQVKGTTSMDTILFPTRPGISYSVDPAPLDIGVGKGEASAFKANVKDTSGVSNEQYEFSYYILHDLSKKRDIAFGSTTTDGELVYYEKDLNNGRPRRIILRNGSYIKDETEEMFAVQDRGGKTIPELSIEWNGARLSLVSSPNIENDNRSIRYEEIDDRYESVVDLTDIIIYSSVRPVVVTMNGTPQSYSYKDGYVYFNSTPPTGGRPDITPPPISPTSPTNPHGGGRGISSPINPANPDSTGTSGGTEQPNNPDASDKDKMKEQAAGLWSEQELVYLIDHGIVTGSDGSLNLNTQISRAEFTAMILRMLGTELKSSWSGSLFDVSDDEWYTDIVHTAFDIGLIEGSGGYIRPNDPITREEMAKVLIIAYCMSSDGAVSEEPHSFTDHDEISGWATDYIDKAYSLGLIVGYEDGSFGPKQNATREQAMVMTFRLIHSLGVD